MTTTTLPLAPTRPANRAETEAIFSLPSQEFFERAALTILHMDRPCRDPKTRACRYLSEGRSCAIGAQISLDLLNPETNGGYTVEGDGSRSILIRLGLSENNEHLASSLQHIHDATSTWTREVLSRRLREVARDHGLDVPAWLKSEVTP